MKRVTGLTVVSVLLGIMVLGCAKYVAIPPSQLSDFEPQPGEKYRVSTRRGLAFTTTSFAIEDSMLVVKAVKLRNSSESASVPKTPFSIPIADIDRMDLVTTDTTRSVIIAATITTVIVGGLYWLWQSLPY